MKQLLLKVYFRILDFKNRILPKYLIANKFLSSLYYFVFSNKFKREQFAVLNGKVSHLKTYKDSNSNIYTLIRNTHRIEKGLLMRPRREVFALDFITETVDVFTTLWTPVKEREDKQFRWFYDVLNSYFTTSGENKVVNENANKFYNHIKKLKGRSNNSQNEKASIPYTRLDESKANISYEDFYKLTKYRRSVRWFTDTKVPRELVDKAVLAAAQSPSACNRQPFQYYIIDSPELLKEVRNLPNGIRGYGEGIPMMVVVVGNLDAYFDERDRHIIYIDASLANMSFMLALETLGLSSCAINWPDIEEKEKRMDKILNLKPHQRTLMCMAVGYPDPTGKVAYSEKRDLNYFRKYY